MLWIPIGCRFRHFFSSSKVLLKSLSCGRKGGTLSSNRLQLMDFSNRTILDDSASNCEGKVVAAARRLLQKPQISSHCKESLFLIKETVTEIETISKTINDLTMLMKEANGDEEMMKLAKKELEENEASLRNMEHKILNLLLPHDEMNDSNIILEITAGIGGQEAMLFADDVFNMYFNFIQNNNWHIISCFTDKNTTAGGLRHGSINVGGSQVYQILKYEGGIHRVQRVPKTERSGRIHTSTVSVAVLPQPTEIQVSIKENEIKIETKRASGAGGQHVNTTDSAVRITHFPTGIVVENQTERSQIRNKELALKRLRGLIYEQQLEKQLSQQKLKRKLQVGTSARSEKIRTYNFIQDRVTDHRIGLTVHNLEDFMKGGQTLGFMVESLQVSACEENLQLLMET